MAAKPPEICDNYEAAKDAIEQEDYGQLCSLLDEPDPIDVNAVGEVITLDRPTIQQGELSTPFSHHALIGGVDENCFVSPNDA